MRIHNNPHLHGLLVYLSDRWHIHPWVNSEFGRLYFLAGTGERDWEAMKGAEQSKECSAQGQHPLAPSPSPSPQEKEQTPIQAAEDDQRWAFRSYFSASAHAREERAWDTMQLHSPQACSHLFKGHLRQLPLLYMDYESPRGSAGLVLISPHTAPSCQQTSASCACKNWLEARL